MHSIAIDGPAGAGKSTIARKVAEQLGFIYVDTGSMYRSMALYFIRHQIDGNDEEKIAAAFHNKFGSRDSDVEGIVYENPDDIHIIRRTERYTVPQMDKLQDLLISTRDEEWLDVAPPLSVVESLLPDVPEKDRRNLAIICSNLAVLGTQAPRKKLRASLGLRTALGRSVNEEIYARTGVRIGSGIKRKDVMEELMGGTLGIRLFNQENAQYYYGGRLPKSVQHSLPVPAVSAR